MMTNGAAALGKVLRVRGDKSFPMTAAAKAKAASKAKAGTVKVFTATQDSPRKGSRSSAVRKTMEKLGKGVTILVPVMLEGSETYDRVANRIRKMASVVGSETGRTLRTRTADIRGNEVVFAVMRDM